jgi:membrane-associated progesterone receptor component
MKVKPEAVHGDLTGATEQQLKTLADWEAKFKAKYPIVGRLADS